MAAKAHPDQVIEARKRIRAGDHPKLIAYDLGRSAQWVYLHTRDIRRKRVKVARPYIVAVRLSDKEFDRLDKAARGNGRSHGAEIRSRL
jgi:hypothetical protein